MPVQMEQFRVVGVNRSSGSDVSVVIDAATKAAAEVKAEQMNIETTHIVRLKQPEPTPPSEHELFSAEAAEALTSKRTQKLIEEVIAPVEAAPPPPPPPVPQVVTRPVRPEPEPVLEFLGRPTYAAPATRRDLSEDENSGFRAFSFILVVLLAITAGAYFVLVHEPNNVHAEVQELIFGTDLFTVVDSTTPLSADESTGATMRDAFSNKSTSSLPSDPPIAKDQQIVLVPTGSVDQNPKPVKLELQSVVTSHEGRFAVINGKLYKQGTIINGQKLVEIADDWVLLEQNGEQRVLQIVADKKQ